jgi:hypothetical protein
VSSISVVVFLLWWHTKPWLHGRHVDHFQVLGRLVTSDDDDGDGDGDKKINSRRLQTASLVGLRHRLMIAEASTSQWKKTWLVLQEPGVRCEEGPGMRPSLMEMAIDSAHSFPHFVASQDALVGRY